MIGFEIMWINSHRNRSWKYIGFFRYLPINFVELNRNRLAKIYTTTMQSSVTMGFSIEGRIFTNSNAVRAAHRIPTDLTLSYKPLRGVYYNFKKVSSQWMNSLGDHMRHTCTHRHTHIRFYIYIEREKIFDVVELSRTSIGWVKYSNCLQ